MVKNLQGNTRPGALRFRASEDLTGKEGRLCFLQHDNRLPVAENRVGVLLAEGREDVAPYVLTEGGVLGAHCEVLPIHAGHNVRLILSGSTAAEPGSALVVADGGSVPANRGTVAVYDGSALFNQRLVAIAEESAVVGSAVLCRAYPELVLPAGVPVNKHLVSVALPAGSMTGTVTGMDLPSLPLVVELNVEGPANGDFILARVVAGSKTLAGFAYVLNSAPPATGYTLKGNIIV